MLFDRLLLDLSQAEAAQRSGDRQSAGALLSHAQSIVIELRVSLDMDAWEGAPRLAEIYNWWLRELIGANVENDAERTAAVRTLAAEIADAWRSAALDRVAS